jgi:hypothetical protein
MVVELPDMIERVLTSLDPNEMAIVREAITEEGYVRDTPTGKRVASLAERHMNFAAYLICKIS